jgi:mRNA interferase RelE/StbE
MAWRIEFDRRAEKELAKLEPAATDRILRFLRDRVAKLENPRSIGEALKGSKLGDFWKYRVGDFRIIVSIEDDRVTVLVLRIGDRKEIYR